MSTFKVTPTERRTGNKAPSFFVEAKTEKEAAKNAVPQSRLLDFPQQWKAVVKETKRKGGNNKRRNRNRSKSRLIVPNKVAA